MFIINSVIQSAAKNLIDKAALSPKISPLVNSVEMTKIMSLEKSSFSENRHVERSETSHSMGVTAKKTTSKIHRQANRCLHRKQQTDQVQ